MLENGSHNHKNYQYDKTVNEKVDVSIQLCFVLAKLENQETY